MSSLLLIDLFKFHIFIGPLHAIYRRFLIVSVAPLSLSLSKLIAIKKNALYAYLHVIRNEHLLLFLQLDEISHS